MEEVGSCKMLVRNLISLSDPSIIIKGEHFHLVKESSKSILPYIISGLQNDKWEVLTVQVSFVKINYSHKCLPTSQSRPSVMVIKQTT